MKKHSLIFIIVLIICFTLVSCNNGTDNNINNNENDNGGNIVDNGNNNGGDNVTDGGNDDATGGDNNGGDNVTGGGNDDVTGGDNNGGDDPNVNPGTECSHEWTPSTCESAKKCSKCGKTEGSSLGHNWIPATCVSAKHCETCGKVQGSPLSHKYNAISEIDQDGRIVNKCSLCGEESTKSTDCDHLFYSEVINDTPAFRCSGCEAAVHSGSVICLSFSDADKSGYYRMDISSVLGKIYCNSDAITNCISYKDSAIIEVDSKSFIYTDSWYENIAAIGEIRFGDNVSVIDDTYEFQNYDVIFSDDVELIKTDAICYLKYLKNIYFEGDLPTLEKDALWASNFMTQNDDGSIYDYLPIVWYNEGADGFDAYGRVIQGCTLRMIDQDAPPMPDMTINEFARKSAAASLELVEKMLKDWDKDPLSFLLLVPQCNINEYKEIKDLALEITKDATSDYERAEIIFNWITKNIEYSDEALLYPVDIAFKERRAVCAGYTTLMHDMLAAVGIPSLYTRGCSYFGTDYSLEQIINGDYIANMNACHAWITVYVDGKAIICDPTWGDFDITPNELADSGRATTMVEGISVLIDEIDLDHYSYTVCFDEGELYYFYYGNLTSSSGALMSFNHMYDINYNFRRVDDGNTSYDNTLPGINQAYRSDVISYGNMGYEYVKCIGPNYNEISYRNAMAFVAFEELYYGNHIEIPYRDEFIIEDNGVVYLKLDASRASVFACCSQDDSITIPEKVGARTVTEIHSSALRAVTMKEISLPDTIEKIGFHAFLDCYKLERLVLPRNLKYIEPGAFAYCLALTDLTVYPSLENIGFPDNRTVCYPGLLFDGIDDEQLTVHFMGTEDELDRISFYNPWGNDDVGYTDTEQRDHFMKYVKVSSK